MKLTELQGRLIKRELRADGDDTCEYHVRVNSVAEADGVRFLCPKCWFEEPVGSVGTHGVICWFRGKVPDDADPSPGRWTPQGTGLDDLTFVPGDPPMAHSVLLLGGCAWHGFVNNGDAT